MDLKKIILQVLEESHLHIPREVYQDMMDYYIQMYKKFRVNQGKRVTDKAYPPRAFNPDFSKLGASFNFVNSLPALPTITLRFTADNGQQFCRFQSGYNSEIQVSLNDPERVYTEVLEHELLHSLQNVLKKHEQQRRSNFDPSLLRKVKKNHNQSRGLPNVKYAGVPRKKFINHYYDWHGYPINSTARRRTTHQNRPIEYYPDLLSSIRSMQRAWVKFAAAHAMDEKAVNSEEKKKNFYLIFSKNVKDNQPYPDYAKNYMPTMASHCFERFKSSGKEFLNMMLAKLYDGFVNKPIPFDYNKFKEIRKETEDEAFQKGNEKLLKQGISEANFVFDKRQLKLDYYDRGDLFRFVEDEKAEEYLDGNTSEYADQAYSEIGLRPKEDKRYNEYLLFPSKIENVVKIFKKIEKLKNSSNLFKRAGEHQSSLIWDGIKKYIYAIYKRALSTQGIPNLDKRWYQNIPTEEREQSRANYYKQIEEYNKKFEDFINGLYTESL